MPEIIDINKQLSYGKKRNEETEKGVVYSSVFSLVDRSLISVRVFNYSFPLLCA
jgi:hypothetical protein